MFTACRGEGRAALVGYLPAGYPTVDASVTTLRAMVDAGCDLVEVGVPYSDPVMDGPTIQAAADAALRAGVRLRDVLGVVEQVSTAGGRVVVMSYWNPLRHYGINAFARDLAAAGGLGIITPDLVPDEAAGWVAASQTHELDRIFLLAPSSTQERVASTAAACTGFVYAASTMGVTGARSVVSSAAPALVARVRQHSDIPVGVGLRRSPASPTRSSWGRHWSRRPTREPPPSGPWLGSWPTVCVAAARLPWTREQHRRRPGVHPQPEPWRARPRPVPAPGVRRLHHPRHRGRRVVG